MSHYAGQGLEREPFSNSPDPGFLCATRQHATCLQELEISLRLRRGLNVVTGDIGTGKTTLCRSLLRTFAEDRNTDVHLLLDPHFETCEDFLRVILISVSGLNPEPGMGLWALKEALKQQLFRLSLVEKRLVILVIDEGQKISMENLEILREMLNYETNTSKLLQIVLFGQRELEPMIEDMPNLADRINVHRRLTPMTFAETRQMIRHRLSVASGGGAPAVTFSFPAMLAIFRASGGSPRKTVRLCHMAMLEMLLRGKTKVRRSMARAAIRPDEGAPRRPRRAVGLATLAMLMLAFGALWFSLGAPGPVLGPVAAPGQLHTPGFPDSKPQAQPDAAPGPETSAASLNTEGLTLRPDQEEEAQSPASRLSLLPLRDQGPAVRSTVDTSKPPRLQVGLTEQEAAPIQAALVDAGDTRHSARKASFTPERP